jgi:methylmalonyl-CoA/ethylmalonyl-CoA epimerase
MADEIVFDHLAIGIETWKDAYPRFITRLGGVWSHGGDAGEFAPYQLVYGHGMKLEFIAPGSLPDGFMRRFMARHGPRPHHLTFKVPALADVLGRLREIGIDTLGGRNEAYWKEAFLHPKQAGMGTLIQLAESDEEILNGFRPPAPAEVPPAGREPLDISWIGLTVASLDTARTLLADHLNGRTAREGSGWCLLSWGAGRNLLVRERDAAPGGAELWLTSGLGVGHILFGPPELVPGDLGGAGVQAVRMPDDPATGVAVLRARHAEPAGPA